MTSALRNGIEYGSNEWKDMYDALQDVDSSIISCENDLKDLSIKELLKKKEFLKIIKEVSRRIKIKKLSYKLNKQAIQNLDTDYIITTRTFHNKIVNKYAKKAIIEYIPSPH